MRKYFYWNLVVTDVEVEPYYQCDLSRAHSPSDPAIILTHFIDTDSLDELSLCAKCYNERLEEMYFLGPTEATICQATEQIK